MAIDILTRTVDSFPVKTLVSGYLHPKQALSAVEMIPRVREGLHVSEFDALRDLLDLTDRELARKVGVSVPTLYRRRQSKTRLDSQASDHIMRFARLFGQAVEFFEGDEAAARRWLKRPAPTLSGLPPLDAAETEVGARAVEQLLGRLEHGVLA